MFLLIWYFRPACLQKTVTYPTIYTLMLRIITNISVLKLVIMWECQNTKITVQRATLKLVWRSFFLSKKSTTLCHEQNLLTILMVEKFLKRFMEKRWKRQNKQCLDWKINKKKNKKRWISMKDILRKFERSGRYWYI